MNKAEELAQDVRYYIEYPSQREIAAQAGRHVVASNQGALPAFASVELIRY